MYRYTCTYTYLEIHLYIYVYTSNDLYHIFQRRYEHICTNVYILIQIMACMYILINQCVIYEPNMKTRERHAMDSFI